MAVAAQVANAQDLVKVQISHDFSVGKAVLPAGSYTILRSSLASPKVLLIRNDHGKSAGLFVPMIYESKDNDREQLEFTRDGDSYALTEIVTRTGIYTVAADRIQRVATKQAAGIQTTGQ